ncbi:MAG: histidine phosphatase family protein [Lachnospiraceae bacterium]|nr:histidine phosphatase family protein [Lachnospiraceae bacterium]
MKLIFIRHGDPDYEHDTLTEKGRREAALLADRMKKQIAGERSVTIYQSPLGRARDTAAYVIKALADAGIHPDVTTLDWLQEFQARFDPNLSETARKAYTNELKTDPATSRYLKRILWDILPSYYGRHPELFGMDSWRTSELARCSDMPERYDEVINRFDSLIADHGYERDGCIYRVLKGNDDVIVFFCHFAISAVILSHLWNVSPFTALQFFAAAPTSVTEVVTEEREQGIACFRTLRYGDITHLGIGGEEPSFSARFCERYENANERH